MVSSLDACSIIRKSYISNDITTYDLDLLNKIYVETFYLNAKCEKTIFISHSSANRQESLYIASDLKKSNYNVWFDEWESFYMRTMSKKPIIIIILDESEPPAILSSRKYYRLDGMDQYDLMLRTLKDSLHQME